MGESVNLTIRTSREAADRTSEIAGDLGITRNEYYRRLEGLGSVLHKMLQESQDGTAKIIVTDIDGNVGPQHIVTDLTY
jgi:hypothetical protein